MALAGAGDALYWTDTMNGVVMRMPAAGGAAVAISGAETTAPTRLSAKGTTVVWLDGRTIRTNANGAVSTVAMAPDDVRGIALSDDGATVYFSWGSKIQSVPLAGGAPSDVVLQDSGGLPAAMAVQGNLMVFTIEVLGGIDITQLGPVVAHCWTFDSDAAVDTTDLDVNCDRIGYAGSLDADVVLAAGATAIFINGESLETNPLAADAPQSHGDLVEDSSDIRTMTFANGQVFFVDGMDATTGAVQMVSATAPSTGIDTTPIALARNLRGPTSIAVAGSRVFWTTSDCEIQATPSGR